MNGDTMKGDTKILGGVTWRQFSLFTFTGIVGLIIFLVALPQGDVQGQAIKAETLPLVRPFTAKSRAAGIPPRKGGGTDGYRFTGSHKIEFYEPPPGEMTRPKPRGVITMKVGPKKKHHGDAKRALCALDLFMNDKYHYPVIIWYNNLSDEVIATLKSVSRSDITFVKLIEDSSTIPHYVDRTKVPEKVAGANLGYRHMNQFRVVDMWNHPALKDYDFYMSIDADTFLTAPVPYDPFRRMVDQDLNYGFVDYHRPDPQNTVRGFWTAVIKYVETNDIKPDHLHDFVDSRGHYTRKVYYGCFQMGRISFFRSKEYTDFAMYLARLGGIYYHRWADQGIYPLALALFAPRKSVVEFVDFPFFHVTFQWPNERLDKMAQAFPNSVSGPICKSVPAPEKIGYAAEDVQAVTGGTTLTRVDD